MSRSKNRKGRNKNLVNKRRNTFPSSSKKGKQSNWDIQKLKRTGIPLLILVVFALVYHYSFDSKLNLNGDNASYYLLGKSLSLGEGYNLHNDLFAKAHNHFPPGYPVILGFFMLFSKSTIFLKCINGLFMAGVLLLSYKVFSKFKVGFQVALVSVLLMTFNYHLMKSSTIIMSEIPFLFFSLLSFLLIMQIDFSKNFLKNKYFYLFVFCLSFSFHIRTMGIAVWAGFLLHLLLEKKWKGFGAVFLGFIVLAAPWQIRAKVLGLGSNYVQHLFMVNPYRKELGTVGFSDMFTRILKNIERYINKEIPSGMLPFIEINYKAPNTWDTWVLGILLILIVVWGIIKLPKYKSFIIGYMGGTFVILLLWPNENFGPRFLLPLIPLLLFLASYSISWCLGKLLELINFRSPHLPFAVLLVLFLYTQKFKINKDQQWQSYPTTRLSLEAKSVYYPKWKNYFEIAKYVKDRETVSDIVACRKPQLFHIFSDVYTCMYPFEPDDQKIIENLKRKNVKYVVIDQLGYSSTPRYLVPAVQKNSRMFKQILHLKNPDTYLLEFFPNK